MIGVKGVLFGRRYFNQVGETKGKIRVYCRVRPILPFEDNQGQSVAVSVVDDHIVEHPLKDKTENEEYAFDHVFAPETSQEEVCPFSCPPILTGLLIDL